MYTTLRARLLPDGTVEFENTVSVSRPVDVLVTILEAPHSATADTVTSELPLLEADTVEPDPDATELRPPLAADARYRKIRPLGAGGMGEAWLAQDRETGQRVCLKQLQARMDTALLLQEFRAMARLEHPGFVRLLDLDLTGFAPVLVMEYIDGLTLRQIMGSRPLLETPAIAIARALFEAVTASHARNILHCDLKPENIIVILDETGRPQPRIIDLGLAVVDHSDAHGNITAATRIAGTPSYMAPEQLRGEVLTPAADVFALGVILFEMLTGRPAREGPMWEVLRGIREATEPLDVREGPLPVRDAVARLIAQCTHPDPRERPAAQVVATQLGFLDIEPAPPVVVAPQELDEWDATSLHPTGWFNSSGYVDGVSLDYPLAVFQSADGRSRLRLDGLNASDDSFGSWMQRFPAAQLAGRTVRLEGELSCRGVSGWAGLWLRADGVQGNLAFCNMASRPLVGTAKPDTHGIELTIPDGVVHLNFGAMLKGRGTLDIHALRLTTLIDGTWRHLCLTL